MHLLEKDPSLVNTAKAAVNPGQSTTAAGGDYRRPSRFADVPPPAREMPDKHPRGFHDEPPRPPGPADNRGSFQGYGQASNPPPLVQSGIGDFRGLHDKMHTLYPGSQMSGSTEAETLPTSTPSFSQPSPGGMSAYARPPPSSIPPAGFGMSGPHWSGMAPMAAPNGRQDWRPGFSGSSGLMSDYHNPMQQRLSGNWQADGMPFSRFH